MAKKKVVVEAISEFRGRFRFLSNFWLTPVWFEGRRYPSLEHAFQAAKTLDAEEREWIREASDPQTAKRRGGRSGERGRRITLRLGWEEMKVDVMRELLAIKFVVGSDLAVRLLATGECELIEGNWWGDRFWGVCDGRGENWLGRLLMELRADLRIDD
jgi:N-glycosidase YbiA